MAPRKRKAPDFKPPFEVVTIGPCTLVRGDCREALQWYSLAADTGHVEAVHACVTDPPYELGFMGKSWDSSGVAADPDTWGWVLEAMRPGAHIVAFAGSRTYHRIATAIEDAGAEIRDQLMWVYGSGFPKSMDIAKAIDKAAGDVRPVLGKRKVVPGVAFEQSSPYATGRRELDVT